MTSDKRKEIEAMYQKRNKELRDEGIDFYDCEWCHLLNPKGTFPYKKVNVFGEDHIICIDCFNHLGDL